jgi:predicted unusual protein kinase regulating ubiquinone biosynthesis (AarF/ABC1/UbiB family)
MLIFTFKQVEDTFVQIDPEPLGAASLAQVHKFDHVDFYF